MVLPMGSLLPPSLPLCCFKWSNKKEEHHTSLKYFKKKEYSGIMENKRHTKKGNISKKRLTHTKSSGTLKSLVASLPLISTAFPPGDMLT